MNYVERAATYADNIVDGVIPACQHTINACRRFQKDVDSIGSDDFPYYLDLEEARRWCAFLETLPHVKGKWATAGELFKLGDWQIFCTINIFGWRHNDTGLRRFREAYIEVPRKNGKSFWIAGLGVAVLCLDDDIGAEVYCGACTESQAWEVFRPAKLICERKPGLRAKYGIEANAKSITRLARGSFFQPIIGNPGDGAGPSFAIADEFHEHPDSDQVDTMITGMGARDQPLMAYITTAGTDMGGPCYTKRDDTIKILNGTVDDERIFGIIYGIDEGDQWDTTEALQKANPNYGVSVNADFLEGQLKQARRSPSKQSSYKTKHLDMWVGAKAAWMNMLSYQACRRKSLNIDDFKGRRCFIALDLASKIDIASMGIVFPPDAEYKKWAAFVKHYLPEDTILDNERYQGFHAGGWLTSTPGNVTDYSYIEDDLLQARDDFEIVEVPYDPFQATQFVTRMTTEGFQMVEVGATVKNFSEPMKELEALIIAQNIYFNMCPILNWMFNNVVAKVDKKDNIFPNKERPENKIDGPITLIMAVNRALAEIKDVPDDGALMAV
jgi:phage terminase large subunit-like protein